MSVYGLGRFPVTLYYEQWARLLDAAGDLRTFLEESKAEGKLKLKEEKYLEVRHDALSRHNVSPEKSGLPCGSASVTWRREAADRCAAGSHPGIANSNPLVGPLHHPMPAITGVIAVTDFGKSCLQYAGRGTEDETRRYAKERKGRHRYRETADRNSRGFHPDRNRAGGHILQIGAEIHSPERKRQHEFNAHRALEAALHALTKVHLKEKETEADCDADRGGEGAAGDAGGRREVGSKVLKPEVAGFRMRKD